MSDQLQETSPSPFIKLTVNIIRNIYTHLHSMVLQRGITVTDAINEALVNYTFIDNALREGDKFLILDRHNQIRQVFFDRVGQEAPQNSARTLRELMKENRP